MIRSHGLRAAAAVVAPLALASALIAPQAHALYQGTPAVAGTAHADSTLLLGGCTATAIAPHTVLTAKHCVKEGNQSGTVYSGHTRGQIAHPVTNVKYAPEGDIAVVTTSKPIAVPVYAKISSVKPQPGTQGSVCSWGTGTGDTLSCTTGVTITGFYDGPKQAYGRAGSQSAPPFFATQYPKPVESRAGDSGSSLFDADGRIIGVLSSNAGTGPLANYSAVYPVADWLNQIVAADGGKAPEHHKPAPAPVKPGHHKPAPAPVKPEHHKPAPAPVKPEHHKPAPSPAQPEHHKPAPAVPQLPMPFGSGEQQFGGSIGFFLNPFKNLG